MSTTTKLEFETIWEKPDWNNPILFGLQHALDGSTKRYKAYVIYPESMGHKRVESPVYEAVDAADPTFQNNGRPIQPIDRDHIVAKATVIRSQMTPQQKSRQDMDRIADDLRVRAVNEYSQWLVDEDERKKRMIEDEEAKKAARTWLYGMRLLLEQGTEADMSAIKTLFWSGRAPDTRQNHHKKS